MGFVRPVRIKSCTIILTISLLLALCFMQVKGVEAFHYDELSISAAMSLKMPFEEIEKLFEEHHPDVDVLLNFNSSGKLRQQIEAGAPVDIFASASVKEMRRLLDKRMIAVGTMRILAGNEIVVIVPGDSGFDPGSFSDLKDESIKRIVIGNPDTTPVGMYSKEVLQSTGVWDAVKDRIVFAEHARQVLDYVARGEVDAGLAYSTDAMLGRRDVKVVIKKAPRGSHREIKYPIGVVKGVNNREAADAFIAAVFSKEGRDILRKYGFRIFER
ncbi:molybdate-binding periplasmic protein precursor [bacterium BMS3Abin07]|nr:molybdate-binding periplasmic protein precursor [bacterium BMS3Abin07]GBE31726.1 molybdate-binding periplasmic protein precursor [bacterium BMS3Bbin05]HDL21344.1 molybdate ABC transporter substrate-binding protein [Nitrospirota bacterium]HDO23347.1 molybdate ABC transporter substrate-binding protein [Nitrospirota bacterium]